MKRKIRGMVLLLACFIFLGMLSLTACTFFPSNIRIGQKTLEMEEDFSYLVKKQQSLIHVDQIGYGNKDKKIAFFSGRNLENAFEIRDADNDHIVFKGQLRKIRSDQENDIYMGEFTEFTKSGRYYVYNSDIGDSDLFEISDVLYSEIFKYYFSLFQEKSEESVSCKVYSLSNLLFTKELFPNTEIEDVFFQTEISKLGRGLENNQQMTNAEKAEVAGLLAQCASVYRKTDVEFSTRCLKLASSAYIYLVNEKADLPNGVWRFLNCQMYRATGYYQYRNKISQLEKSKMEEAKQLEHDYGMLSDFAYLMTTYPTDYKNCKEILDYYLDYAQQISENSSRENFYVLSNADSIETSQVLDYLMVLGIVNYVLSGREYEVVQKNYIHYYLGGNTHNENILMNEEFLKQMKCEDLSKMLFVMSSLCD